MARIHYLDDDNQPQVIEVDDLSGDVLIGRSSECQIRTAGHSVSRKHARVGWQDGLYVLEDLGSSNGTFYFTDRLDPNVPVILEDGVLFRCGAFELRFEREGLDATLEQPAVYPEEGIPPPPAFEIPPPPMDIPPPPFEIPPPPFDLPLPPVAPPPPPPPPSPPPPPPPPPLAVPPSPEDASTSGFALNYGDQADVQVRVSSAQPAVTPALAPDDVPDDEPDAEPLFDDDFGADVTPAPVAAFEDAESTDDALGLEPELNEDTLGPTPDDEGQPEPAFIAAADAVAAPESAPADGALEAELAAARDEVEARTALWRQALADLSEAHAEADSALARATAAEGERDRLQAAFTEAEGARRQLLARLELREAQQAAAEAALFAELAAARAGRPSPANDGELTRLRAELAEAQAALQGLDDQAEAEAVELRRQLTEALAENDRLSAELDAAGLPTAPLGDHAGGGRP